MIATTSLPYPGLRPFEQSEADIFFGREEQTDELLRRLSAQRFLAVIGSSGCGKSSLVRAGMLPALETGFMASAGPRWRTATMRPGSHPFANLARELLKDSALKPERGDTPTARAMLLATLRRGPLGLVEALRETPLPKDANLLVLVDQFEEIFRFRHDDENFEADAFVSLLLGSAGQREVPIYIVITMRSDYIGNCAAFTGLPEAINKSEYLTPRLSREQMRAAIEGPAQVFGGKIEPALVNRLLNDTGGDPENLPVLQHLLMRMWTYRHSSQGGCSSNGSKVADRDAEETGRVLIFDDYKNVGGFEGALSQHANQAFTEGLDKDGIGDKGRRIAEIMYRRLCEVGSNRPDSRRPSRFSEVTAVVLSMMADAKEEDIFRTANVFRSPQYGFLVPPSPEALEDRILDLPHESLIRRWNLLKTWADREADSASTYRDLEHDAQRYKESRRLWVKPYLDVGLAWKQRENPTKEWAARYGGDLDVALAFLEKSRQARRVEGFRMLAPYAVLALLIVVGICSWFWIGEWHKSQSRSLAVSASELVTSDPEASVWFGLLAAEESRTFEAQRVLQRSLQEDRVRLTLPHHTKVRAVSFSTDGRLVATGAEDGIARVWDSTTGKELYSFDDHPRNVNQGGITAVVFVQRSEENILETIGADGRIRLHYLTSGENKIVPDTESNTTSIFREVTLSADGNYVAASNDLETRVWNLQTGKIIPSKIPNPGGLLGLSGDLSEQGQENKPPSLWLAAEDGPSIRIWELATGKSRLLKPMIATRIADTFTKTNVETITPEKGPKTGSFTGPSPQTFESIAQRLHNPISAKFGGEINNAGIRSKVNSLAFSPKGSILAVAQEDGSVQLLQWRAKGPSGETPQPRTAPGHSQDVRLVAFSPDGNRLVTARANGSLQIWDVGLLEERMTLVGHSAPVLTFAFSPDGKLLVTGSEDGTAKIWDVSPIPSDDSEYLVNVDKLMQLAQLRLATYPQDEKRGVCLKYLRKPCSTNH